MKETLKYFFVFILASFVAGPQGEIIYEASADDEESIIVEMDMAHSEQVRRW